jgi:hypothetical protein
MKTKDSRIHVLRLITKNNFPLFALMLTMLVSVAASSICLADGAEWPFFSSATFSNDSSGNGHTLTISGGPAWSSAVPPGSGLSGSASFLGAGTSFCSSNSVNMSAWNQMHYSCWFNTTASSINMLGIDWNSSYLNAPGSVSLGYGSGDITARWQAGLSGTTNQLYMRSTSTGKLADGNWHFVRVDLDPNQSVVANRMWLTVDGVVQTSASNPSAPTTPVPFVNDVPHIGNRNNNLYWFNGNIADVKISGDTSQYTYFPGAQITGNGWTLTVANSGSNIGAIEMDYAGDRYLISSLFSEVVSGVNKYHYWRWNASADPLWTTTVSSSAGVITVLGSCGSYTVTRSISWNGDKFTTKDKFTNLTANPIPIGVRYYPVMANRDSSEQAYLTGYSVNCFSTTGTKEVVPCAENPSAFISQDNSSLGILVEDDVFRGQLYMIQETDPDFGGSNYNTTDMRTQAFGLPGNKSYTFNLSLYPGALSQDYWGFINSVRNDWGVNYTCYGPMSFGETYYPGRACQYYIMDPWYEFLDGSGTPNSTYVADESQYISGVMSATNSDTARLTSTPTFMSKIETVQVAIDKTTIVNGNLLPGGGSPNWWQLNPLSSAQTSIVQSNTVCNQWNDATLFTTSTQNTEVVDCCFIGPSSYTSQTVDTNPANWFNLQTYPGATPTAWATYGTNWQQYTLTNFNYQTQYMKGQVDFTLNNALTSASKYAGCTKGIYFDMFGIEPDLYDNGSNDPSFYWSPRWDESQWDGYTMWYNGTATPSDYFTDTALVGIPARAWLINYVTSTMGAQLVTNTHCRDSVCRQFHYNNFAETYQTSVPDLTSFKNLVNGTTQPWCSQSMASGHLTSPIALGISASDPTYNTTGVDSMYGRQHIAQAVNKYAIMCLTNGELMYYYSAYIPTSGAGSGAYGITNYMFPFTPVELHAGYLIGKEKILTCKSGTFYWSKTVHSSQPSNCLVFDSSGLPISYNSFSATDTGTGTWKVVLSLQSDWNNACAIW